MSTLIQTSIQLVTFQTHFLQALSLRDSQFEEVSKLKTTPDWPNPEFAKAIPFFIQMQTETPALENWNFLIVTRHNSMVVGEIGSKGPVSDRGEIEVGYGIASSHHRRGYATLALKEFIRLASQDPSIKTITAECLTHNIGSTKTLERCHFERVGTRSSDEGELILWRLGIR
jgi:RimJ/RimL family protein N-acetyltransferase